MEVVFIHFCQVYVACMNADKEFYRRVSRVKKCQLWMEGIGTVDSEISCAKVALLQKCSILSVELKCGMTAVAIQEKTDYRSPKYNPRIRLKKRKLCLIMACGKRPKRMIYVLYQP